MMITLAIVNQKGGVGKTTTAVTLATGLALRGWQVLLVDLDAQGNCADSLGVEKRGGVYDLLVADGNYSGIVQARDGVGLIASDKSTVKAQKVLSGESFSEYVLRDRLRALQPAWDIIIIDSAPGAGLLQINALIAATHILIPVSLAHLATVGAVGVLGTVQSLRQVGAFKGQWLGLLPTMWDRTTNESHDQLKAMVQRFGGLVWPPIPVDVKAREAPGHGQTLWEYAPACRALLGVTEGAHRVGGYVNVMTRLVEEVR